MSKTRSSKQAPRGSIGGSKLPRGSTGGGAEGKVVSNEKRVHKVKMASKKDEGLARKR